MPRVSYTAPATVDEAVKALAGAAGQAKVLSGGTDLLVQLKSGRLKPELIVDTKRIPGIIGIREEGDYFVIGAATPGVMISADERLEHAWPGIVEGVDLIGSTQIQGRASIAGNLCNASPAADSVPPVIAARAIAVVAGPNGRREVPVENIVTGPGRTSLAKGEFVVEFKIPKPKPRQCDAYLRFIPRTEMDIAVVGCAVNVTLDAGGTCTDARVVLGAVAPTQLIVEDAAQGADRPQARRRHAEGARRGGAGRLQADHRQARHDRIPHQGRRRAGAPGGRHRLRARRGALTRVRETVQMSKHHVTTTINGEPVEYLCEAQQTMLDVLRDELNLTGSKEGCGSGDCGACTIIVDGKIVCSCLMLGVEAEGRTITTIEGIAEGDKLHPVQQKFLEHAALQCGFCTPGFIVAAKALLDENPNPTEEETRYWLAGNLCRCTGYDKIVRAVLDAAAVMRGETGRRPRLIDALSRMRERGHASAGSEGCGHPHPLAARHPLACGEGYGDRMSYLDKAA